MAKDHLGNTLQKGDQLLVTLADKFVFATVVELQETQIMNANNKTVKQPIMLLTFNIPLSGPLNQALGAFKVVDPRKNATEI